jgi:hypothetical protein
VLSVARNAMPFSFRRGELSRAVGGIVRKTGRWMSDKGEAFSEVVDAGIVERFGASRSEITGKVIDFDFHGKQAGHRCSTVSAHKSSCSSVTQHAVAWHVFREGRVTRQQLKEQIEPLQHCLSNTMLEGNVGTDARGSVLPGFVGIEAGPVDVRVDGRCQADQEAVLHHCNSSPCPSLPRHRITWLQ